MKSFIIAIVSGLALVTGCAHHTARGTVAMTVDDDDVHVCLDDNQVKPGDRVAFFKNECDRARGGLPRSGSESQPVCSKVKIGDGEVVQNLNKHYATVHVLKGAGTIREGTVVEKVR